MVSLQHPHLGVRRDGLAAIDANDRISFAKIQQARLAKHRVKKVNLLPFEVGLRGKRSDRYPAFHTR